MVDTQWDSTKQPKPTPNDEKPVWDYVIEDEWAHKELTTLFENRKQFGFEKYKTHLQPFNSRNAKEDLLQELLDALVYAKQTQIENKNSKIGTRFEYIYYSIAVILDENYEFLIEKGK